MIARLRFILARFLKKTGITSRLEKRISLPEERNRDYYAARYICGEGIEIGALHNPQYVPDGVKVVYIDIISYEECVTKFPELDSSSVVRPTVIEDGFVLDSIPDESQDFVIAHHVLEHSPNPIQVLLNWGRVLRKGGRMLISVPAGDLNFDKGREVTSIEHLLDDFELYRRGVTEEIQRRNKQHYEEWLLISGPALLEQSKMEPLGLTKAEVPRVAEEYAKVDIEIHFHTFTYASFKEFLNHFCTHVDQSFIVEEFSQNAMDIIAVLVKRP